MYDEISIVLGIVAKGKVMQRILRVTLTSSVLVALSIAALCVNYRYFKNYFEHKLIPYQYAKRFGEIYRTEHWGVGEGSGKGSNPNAARSYLALLQEYLNDPRFHTIVDLGCGDWQLMSKVTIPKNKQYYGYDVVPWLIAANNKKFAVDNLHFLTVKHLRDFEKTAVEGDLLIVKDVLQHWPNSEIEYFINKVLPHFKYALITNDYNPRAAHQNLDIMMGYHHPLDLTAAPYGLKNAHVVLEYAGPENKRVLFYTNPKFIN